MVRMHYAARAVCFMPRPVGWSPILRTLCSGWSFRSRPSSPGAPLLQTHYPPSSLLRAHAQIPVPLIFFSCSALRRRPCRLHHQRLVIGTVPLWSVFLSWSAAPLVPAVRRVHLTSSSPSTSAFASLRWLGSSARVPTKRLPVGLPFRYGRHSFMLRPSSLFALLTVRHHQLAPEDVLHPSLLSLRCLRDSRVCYPADWSIAGAGLSPARKTAAVGCTIMQEDVGQQR